MATDIVQCNYCDKVVKQREAHGWLEVKVWVTKPTQEELDEAMMSQQGRAMLGDTEPGPRPPIDGGDFCSLFCMVKHAEKQQDRKTEDQQTKTTIGGNYI